MYFIEIWTVRRLPAYSGGSDWRKIEIMRVDPKSGEGKKLDDVLEYVKFSSIAWTHDHKVRTASPLDTCL